MDEEMDFEEVVKAEIMFCDHMAKIALKYAGGNYRLSERALDDILSVLDVNNLDEGLKDDLRIILLQLQHGTIDSTFNTFKKFQNLRYSAYTTMKR